jgi:tetratricopeptide (TPR) repeat protein
MIVIAVTVASVAAGGTVLLALATASHKGGVEEAQQPLTGAPPLVLDLGVRTDPEARAFRRAERLLAKNRRAAAGRIFERYDSPEARIGAAFAAWPDTGLAKLERLALERRGSSLVLLHLGFANLWAGRSKEATAAWREAALAQPDSLSAQRADNILHPNFPAGQPLFVPSFPPPKGIDALSPPAQLAALARAARGSNVHAKLLYGRVLQQLGHRLSARREYDAAVKLAPQDPEARVAAAVSRFDKAKPAEAFSRLGPLTRRFPKAATVRFHLGLLLFWLAESQPGSIAEGKRQLRLAQAQDPGSPLAVQARKLLVRIESAQKR